MGCVLTLPVPRAPSLCSTRAATTIQCHVRMQQQRRRFLRCGRGGVVWWRAGQGIAARAGHTQPFPFLSFGLPPCPPSPLTINTCILRVLYTLTLPYRETELGQRQAARAAQESARASAAITIQAAVRRRLAQKQASRGWCGGGVGGLCRGWRVWQ